MKAFGAKKKTPFEIEKEKKEQKKKEEESAAAAVYAEFVDNFSKKASDGSKTFVRGETVLPSAVYNANVTHASTGELYTLAANKDDTNRRSLLPEEEVETRTKKKDVKKKSNLELFKEQLKQEQEQREMKKAIKKLRDAGASDDPQIAAAAAIAAAQAMASASNGGVAVAELLSNDDPYAAYSSGSYAPTGDQSTTNIYVGNLSPEINEDFLCKAFGKFGPLASVKVMWPRTADEKSRGRNCGFVAFMDRPAAEKAMAKIDGTVLGEHEVKLGWGKAIPIPPVPFFVLRQEHEAPVAPTGMPFNARPTRRAEAKREREMQSREYGMVAPPPSLGGGDAVQTSLKKDDDVIREAEVIVKIPEDKNILRLIHKTIEFVVREGAAFETIILSREFHNPLFRFMVDFLSPEHVYYRWKLYSILQGDRCGYWPTDKFRLYQGGSWWIPPPKVKEKDEVKPEEVAAKKGMLKSSERDEFEDMLRGASMDRDSVKAVMGFCLDHCDAAEEIVECLTESMTILETPIPTKIARLFMISDVLHNTAVSGASYYRRGFEQQLPTIFKHLNEAYRAISGRIRAEYFKKHVMNVLNAWDSWCLYPSSFLAQLKMLFLTVPQVLIPTGHIESAAAASVKLDEDIDGEDIDGEDIDGEELPAGALPGRQGQGTFKTSFAPSKAAGQPSGKWASISAASSVESSKRARIDSKWESDGEDDGDSAGASRRRGSADTGDDTSSTSKKARITSKWETDKDDEEQKPAASSKWKTI